MIFFPVATLPVNEIFRTPGFDARCAPSSLPPESTFSTPGGTISFRMSATMRDVSGVYGDGFATTVLPASQEGASFHASRITGKFQGVIAATTPSGLRTI